MKYSENSGLICHPHDVAWINEQLARVRPYHRASLVKRYSDHYSAMMQKNSGIKAEGIARRTSNTKLREVIDQILSTDSGEVFSPSACGR